MGSKLTKVVIDYKLIENKKVFTIGEAANILKLPQHVIRFWETKFPNTITPMRRAGNRRYYTLNDIEKINTIRNYLYIEGLSIRGLQKLVKQQPKIFSHEQIDMFVKDSSSNNYENADIIAALNKLELLIKNELKSL